MKVLQTRAEKATAVGVVAGGVLAGMGALLLYKRKSFLHHIDAWVKDGGLAKPRTDLPPEVVALAAHYGVPKRGGCRYAEIHQAGMLFMTPGGKPIPFTAKQYIRTDACGFSWLAHVGRPSMVSVLDYYAARTGGLQVWALGLLPLQKVTGAGLTSKGELLRYLAELPLNPDMILYNRALNWTVVDKTTLKVSTGTGDMLAEITFTLASDGLIDSMYTPERQYGMGKDAPMRPWRGRYIGHKPVEGRQIPTETEAGWELPDGYFVYWRGQITEWKGMRE